MKVLYALNMKFNRYYIVDTVTKEKVMVHKKELIELYKSDGIYNIKVYGDQINGRNVGLSRFSDLSSMGRAYVFKVISKNGQIHSYKITTSTGDIMSLTDIELYRTAQLTGVVNIDTNELKKGNIKLLNNTYENENITTKTLKYTYDVEDYLNLYNRYKSYGFSMDRPKMGEYTNVFDQGFSLNNMNMESDCESFIKNHKLLVSIINSANVTGATPIYKHIEIGYSENKYKYTVRSLMGYVVSFEILHKGQVYNRQVIIDKTDKKLLAVMPKASKFTARSIRDLVTYKNYIESSIDGAATQSEIRNGSELLADYINMLKKAKSGQVVSITLGNGKYTSNDGISLKIRNNLKINAMENRYLFNLLLK